MRLISAKEAALTAKKKRDEGFDYVMNNVMKEIYREMEVGNTSVEIVETSWLKLKNTHLATLHNLGFETRKHSGVVVVDWGHIAEDK